MVKCSVIFVFCLHPLTLSPPRVSQMPLNPSPMPLKRSQLPHRPSRILLRPSQLSLRPSKQMGLRRLFWELKMAKKNNIPANMEIADEFGKSRKSMKSMLQVFVSFCM